MRKFEVGDRVITKWDDSLMARALYRWEVPDGEHVIIEISGGDARLDDPDGYWYPLKFMTKVDSAPTTKLKECAVIDFRDQCAIRAMQAFLSVGDVEYNIFLSDAKGRELTRWIAEDSYAYADAMLEARKK